MLNLKEVFFFFVTDIFWARTEIGYGKAESKKSYFSARNDTRKHTV